MSKRLLQYAAIALFTLSAAGAAAHGDTPLPESFTGAPGGSSGWVLKANFGVITSDQPCHLVCEEAFGGGDRFSIAAYGLDEWVLFTDDRIVRTDDGCNFEEVRKNSDNAADWAMHRPSGKLAFFINDGSDKGIWMSTDRGKSFSRMEVEKPDLTLTTLQFTGDGRLFVAGYVPSTDPSSQAADGRFFFADKPGEVTEVSAYEYPQLLASHGDKILWLGRSSEGQELVLGRVDQPVGSTKSVEAWPSGATFSEDGTEIWVSGVEKESRGFLHGTLDGENVSWELRHSGHSALCVGYGRDDLHVCGKNAREGFDLQRRTGSGELEGLVNFEQLAGPRQNCPEGSDVATTCPAVWSELAKSLDIDPDGSSGGSCDSPAGGGPDAGGEADAGGGDATGGSATGSSCSTHGGGPAGGLFALIVVVGLLGRRLRASQPLSRPKT